MPDLPDAGRAWSQVPGPPPNHSAAQALDTLATRTVGAVALGAAGPTVHVWHTSGLGPALLVGTILVMAGGATASARWRPASDELRPVIWSGAALLVGTTGGWATGAWALGALVLASWSILARPPLPTLPAGGEALTPAVVLSAIALVSGATHDGAAGALVATGAALVLTAVAGTHGGVLSRWTARVGAVAGSTVSWVTFLALGSLVVLLPWLAHRIFRLDPLTARSTAGWMDRDRLDVRPRLLWTASAADRKPGRLTRLRWALAVPATLLVLAVGLTSASRAVLPSADRAAATPPPAVGDVSWWWDYMEELNWAFQRPGGATNQERFPALHDIHSTYVNVRDGERVSWRPPACACRTIVVWMYGGSTVLGWGQRDEHTIPSELARLAWDQGLSLEVHNRGIAGDLNWQASERFAWDVASQTPPDLVIFYDGSNDLRAAYDRNADRSVGYDPRWPIAWNGNALPTIIDNNRLIQRVFGHPPSGAGRVATTVPPVVGIEDLGRAVMRNYTNGRIPALGAIEARDVRSVWFWQPDRFTKAHVDGEPASDPGFDRDQRHQRKAALDLLPADVHDISNVFAGVDDPMYFDDVHTSERGARIIARRILDVTAPELEALALSSGS